MDATCHFTCLNVIVQPVRESESSAQFFFNNLTESELSFLSFQNKDGITVAESRIWYCEICVPAVSAIIDKYALQAIFC